jgi:hypothetical protein
MPPLLLYRTVFFPWDVFFPIAKEQPEKIACAAAANPPATLPLLHLSPPSAVSRRFRPVPTFLARHLLLPPYQIDLAWPPPTWPEGRGIQIEFFQIQIGRYLAIAGRNDKALVNGVLSCDNDHKEVDCCSEYFSCRSL